MTKFDTNILLLIDFTYTVMIMVAPYHIIHRLMHYSHVCWTNQAGKSWQKLEVGVQGAPIVVITVIVIFMVIVVVIFMVMVVVSCMVIVVVIFMVIVIVIVLLFSLRLLFQWCWMLLVF